MSNPGTALPYAEEYLLDRLEERFATLNIRLLDRDPVLREELGAGDGDGIECALWVHDATATLNPPSVANSSLGRSRVLYDELAVITLRIQAFSLDGSEHELGDVKARAAAALNEVITVAATNANLSSLSGHNLFILTVGSWNRAAGRLANGRGWVARYTVELNLRARLVPDVGTE